MDVVRPALGILGEDVEDEGREAALDAARLGDQREVRRGRAVVGGGGSLHVRERRREVVGRNARPFEHLAVVVGAVLDGVFGGERLHLRFRVAEVSSSVRNATSFIEWQADADFLVDLEAALQLRLVVGAERTGERPVFLLRLRGSGNASARPRCGLLLRRHARAGAGKHQGRPPPRPPRILFISKPSQDSRPISPWFGRGSGAGRHARPRHPCSSRAPLR